jgi:hypothetical protein
VYGDVLQAYTCFNAASGAALTNHGRRIDFILAAAAAAAPTSSAAAAPFHELFLTAGMMRDHASSSMSDHLPIFVDVDAAQLFAPTPLHPSSPPLLLTLSSRKFFTGTQTAISSFFTVGTLPASPSTHPTV